MSRQIAAHLRCCIVLKGARRQLAQWLEHLQEYDIDIVHCNGRNHSNVDALSRLRFLERKSKDSQHSSNFSCTTMQDK